MNLVLNVSGNCWKGFKGQKSKVKVTAGPSAFCGGDKHFYGVWRGSRATISSAAVCRALFRKMWGPCLIYESQGCVSITSWQHLSWHFMTPARHTKSFSYYYFNYFRHVAMLQKFAGPLVQGAPFCVAPVRPNMLNMPKSTSGGLAIMVTRHNYVIAWQYIASVSESTHETRYAWIYRFAVLWALYPPLISLHTIA